MHPFKLNDLRCVAKIVLKRVVCFHFRWAETFQKVSPHLCIRKLLVHQPALNIDCFAYCIWSGSPVRLQSCVISVALVGVIRGTQPIVSVNYLFGRPLIPYDFLKGIFTSNFRDMGNVRPSVFGLIKMSFRVPKKGQLRFSERK